MKNKKLTKAEIEKISKSIIHSMGCEKMPASTQDIENMNDILEGKKNAEQVITEEEVRMKKEGLIK
jgi:hypothetical protein